MQSGAANRSHSAQSYLSRSSLPQFSSLQMPILPVKFCLSLIHLFILNIFLNNRNLHVIIGKSLIRIDLSLIFKIINGSNGMMANKLAFLLNYREKKMKSDYVDKMVLIFHLILIHLVPRVVISFTEADGLKVNFILIYRVLILKQYQLVFIFYTVATF